jgi:hypothetical protein
MAQVTVTGRPAARRTGQCRVCWELVAAILEPRLDQADGGTVEPVRVAKDHTRPIGGTRQCPGSGQPVERLA